MKKEKDKYKLKDYGMCPNRIAPQQTITGFLLYMPVLTVMNGETVYRSLDF